MGITYYIWQRDVSVSKALRKHVQTLLQVCEFAVEQYVALTPVLYIVRNSEQLVGVVTLTMFLFCLLIYAKLIT